MGVGYGGGATVLETVAPTVYGGGYGGVGYGGGATVVETVAPTVYGGGYGGVGGAISAAPTFVGGSIGAPAITTGVIGGGVMPAVYLRNTTGAKIPRLVHW